MFGGGDRGGEVFVSTLFGFLGGGGVPEIVYLPDKT